MQVPSFLEDAVSLGVHARLQRSEVFSEPPTLRFDLHQLLHTVQVPLVRTLADLLDFSLFLPRVVFQDPW